MRLELTPRTDYEVRAIDDADTQPETGARPSPLLDVEIRRVRPSDREPLAEFYARLSPESRRARFLGGAIIPAESARWFCTPDHIHEEGFVALAARPSTTTSTEQDIVGHLCLVPARGHALELGVAVADDRQGRGIGRRLFEAALEWARDGNYTGVTATAFTDNTHVLRLLSSARHPARIEPADGGVVEVVIPLVGTLPTTRSWPPYGASRSLSPRTRVVSRRTRPPGRAAGGSASRGSS